jgi:Holliday junction resolvase RusA-like endonuclease
VKQATKDLPRAKGPCYMSVVFVLHEDSYPLDLPYGTDVDNLMKRLLDALKDTVFSEVEGKDSSVVQLAVSKHKALQNEPTGARVIIDDRRN